MDLAQFASGSFAVSSVLLFWIGQALLFGTLLAGLTFLLTRLPRLRFNPAVETCLWIIVLVKFVVPVGPAWSLSLSSVYRQLVSSASVPSTEPADPMSLDATDYSLIAVDLGNQAPMGRDLYPLESPVGAMVSPPEYSRDSKRAAPPQWHWTALLGMVYVLCIFGLFAARLRSYHRLFSRCYALPPGDEPIHRLVITVCQRVGVRRTPLIRIGDDTPAPFVMGFVCPLLVLPRHLLVRPDELEAVVVHEIAHLRRGDMLVRYLQWVAGTLLFFWPVVAWVNRRLDLSRESACDAWALRHGTLSAQDYARCLLRVVQPVAYPRFAYSPCNMATHPKTIERRIDMILQLPRVSSNRRLWSGLSLALLLVWGGFTLTGVHAHSEPVGSPIWPATEEAVHMRAAEVYHLVAEVDVADFNRDGVLTYLEKDTYLVALALRHAEPFMEEFPYADRNHSGNLDILEANAVIRAITLIAYADRRDSAETEPHLPLAFCHAALDAQTWLLTHQTAEPTHGELDPIWSVLCRVQGSPTGYGARMFNHGRPESLARPAKYVPGDRHRFQELVNHIAVLDARVAVAADDDEVARLQAMIVKLQALLAQLQE
jgi:beta-lactamase regulating signal transducer with metallopeptidase domain